MTSQQELPSLSIYLNFVEGECREAFEFYRSVFGGEFSNIMSFDDMPPDDDYPIPEGWGDKVMHVSLPIGNGILMGSDVPPGFGPPLTIGSNYSVSYRPPSRDEADRVFAALSDGGRGDDGAAGYVLGRLLRIVHGSIRHQLAGRSGARGFRRLDSSAALGMTGGGRIPRGICARMSAGWRYVTMG